MSAITGRPLPSIPSTSQQTLPADPQPRPCQESETGVLAPEPAAGEDEHPSESHALANADHEQRGHAQIAGDDVHDLDIKDLGWHEEVHDVPQPLVGGLPNEELWTLVRRFNKQMYHVKAIPEAPLGGLDLNIADEEEFSPDKLRANIERLYMTVIVGLVNFGKHIARLRSWRERNRTLAFLGVYALAWLLDFLVPTIITFLIIIIAYPPARTFCFPPAPIALIDSKTGGIQSPPAGMLGSPDSLTGAPEKHQGEAVEQEASNFVVGFTSIAIASAAGEGPISDPGHEESKLEGIAPDPIDMAGNIADVKDKAEGGTPSATHDKTKEPVAQAMWSKTRPVMHAIAGMADGWERFGNALSPTAPFPKQTARLKLAGCLILVLLISVFTTSYMFMKINSLVAGLGFFGDPLIWRGLDLLNRKIPHWQKLLELRNTLLKGVPTDAQLTITLLRIGEANKAPLPPPPSSDTPPAEEAHEGAGEDLEHLDVPDHELAAAINPSPTTTAPSAPPKKKHGRRLLAFVKGTAKGGVETMLGTDRLRAAAGATRAKNRLGVVQSKTPPRAGPVDFPARFNGKKGHAYIREVSELPAVLGWVGEKGKEPVWEIKVEDIVEIKKVGGLGFKGKIIVGWATSREIADGILVVDKKGLECRLTAIAQREELFNRLIAMAGQVWEAW